MPRTFDDSDDARWWMPVACRSCGEEGLNWLHTGVRWRLIGPDGRFHVCSNDSAADDFEVLP